MRRDRVGKIVSIGQGLCRVIVRSQRLAERLAQVPGVRVLADDVEHLGWWIIFPETMRSLIEPVFRDERPIITEQAIQLSLFDEADETKDSPEQGGATGGAHPSGG